MIPVVFSTDHGFIMPTGVALLSMLECSCDVSFDIYILQGNDVTDDDRCSLKSIVSSFPSSKIQFISPSYDFSESFEVRNITTPTYYRLLIPWQIPQYNKIIYLDGDIVIKDSLSELYKFKIGDNYVAGVRQILNDELSVKRYAPSIGIDPPKYINAGILIINSQKMRQENLKDIFLKEARKKYVYVDQDIINIVCKDKIAPLPWKFNYIPSNMATNNEPKDACIYHYAGPKPWKILTGRWVDWYDVYRRSPFYSSKLSQNVVFNTWGRKYSVNDLIHIYLSQSAPQLLKLLQRLRHIL